MLLGHKQVAATFTLPASGPQTHQNSMMGIINPMQKYVKGSFGPPRSHVVRIWSSQGDQLTQRMLPLFRHTQAYIPREGIQCAIFPFNLSVYTTYTDLASQMNV